MLCVQALMEVPDADVFLSIQQDAARAHAVFSKQAQTMQQLTTDNEALRTTVTQLTHANTQIRREWELSTVQLVELGQQIINMETAHAQQLASVQADNERLRQEVSQLLEWKQRAASFLSEIGA